MLRHVNIRSENSSAKAPSRNKCRLTATASSLSSLPFLSRSDLLTARVDVMKCTPEQVPPYLQKLPTLNTVRDNLLKVCKSPLSQPNAHHQCFYPSAQYLA